jgi:RND family efflux transporter MFP subunit
MNVFELGRSRTAEQTPQLRVVTSERSGPPHWTGLADARDEAKFCSAWLSSQCANITGVIAGLLTMPPPASASTVTSTSWPERNPYLEVLLRLAECASTEKRMVVFSPARMSSNTNYAHVINFFVATPLGARSEPFAVAAVALASSSSTALTPENVAEQLRWGAGWLEALPWVKRFKDVSGDLARSASCLDVLAAIEEQPRLQGMAIALTNDLAARLHCDRASMGIVSRNGGIRLRAISHSSNFRSRGRLVDAIENAMEEALDQRGSVAYPPLPPTERAVTMAHRALSDVVRASDASLITVVMADGKGRLIGAITLERHRNGLFDVDVLRFAEATAALLGPVFGLQLATNKLVSGRIIDHVSDHFAALFGPRRPALKVAAIAFLSLALFLTLAKGEHRVTANSMLQGRVQRAAVAPFAGFIRSAPVRAGDKVKRGDLLAALDDHDLVLDRMKWRAERDKLLRRQYEALAKHDRSNLMILNFKIREAESQLALAEEKLSRARIVAPFDGIVVSGDLSQMLGSPVEKGKPIFEIAPLHSYRLIIHVDERDIRYISVHQHGTLLLAGMPGKPLRFTVTKITPVTVAEAGQNLFQVEALLTNSDAHLRPGMEGVAKIETGQRSLVWIWAHSAIEWLRLTAWKYLP